MESDAQYLEILQRWEEANVEAIYHEVPARHLQMERSHTEDDLLGIEQASYLEWGSLEDPTDLASEPSTSSRKAGSNVKQGGGRRKRMTKRQFLATQVPEDQVWTKCLVPASRIPELLIQREDMLQKIKEFNNTRTEVKGRWHRAFEMAMEGHEVDRALRNVRDISSKIRQYMFFSESQNTVLKLSSTLSEYDRVWERKRFGRLSEGLRDLSRLAYPIEQLVDARTFECHEIVQQELSAAVQNELSRRAEPMELQRLDRETDNTLKQAEVGRKTLNKKLDDLQHSIHHTARTASHFVKNLKNTLQTVLSDISEFNNAHVTLKNAEKEYKADFYDQIRKNDGYKDSLEKLEARRKLKEGRNQADVETLRSEHTILKRSLATLMALYEECSTRASEIASWLHVLSHQRIEKSGDLMLEVHEGRMRRRRDMFKRIAWLNLQRLSVEIASLQDDLRSSSETLRKKRLEKDVELYRVITCDAKVLLLELRGRCNELNVDGSLKEDINALLSGKIPYQGFFDVIAKELNEQADWLRGRHMNVGISPASLTLSSQGLRLATPTSLLSVADKLLRQRHLKMVVIRNMRRASMPMEEKVEQITQRFKLALLARRHSQTEDDADESFAEDSSADMEDEIERMTEGIDDQTLRQIIAQQHGDLDLSTALNSEVQDQSDQGSVAEALSQLQELSASEGHLHHALAHLLHQLHGAGLEELHDVLKEKLQDISEAWHIAVTAAHSTPEVEGPEMEKSMLWKIREQRFAWLVPLAHQLAKRFGHLRACNEVLWAELGQLGDATHNIERREQVATSVATLLRSLEPLATEEVIKAGEKCMRSFQQVLHGKLHLSEAASKACAHLRHLPDINLVPSDGIAEALPSGPSPHTFVTAIKALIKLLRSDAFADAKVFDRFTGPEILNILCEAVSRDFKAALPDCFRAAMLALADLGEMFQDYEGGGEASMSLSLGLFAGGSQTPKETWGALRAGARQRMQGGTPLVDTPSDGFQLSNSRPLLSRERSQTASSRPWTSTPARPSTEDSTRLPSRQQTDRPSLDLTLEDPPPRLSPDDFPEGQPLDQQDLEFELEKQRLQQANAEQENDLRKLHQEEKELNERLEFLRKSVSQMSQSSEAWRVGELMEELEQVEEARKTIKATVTERQKVTELLKEQRSRVDQQQSLHRERAKIMRSQSLMPRSQSGKEKSLEWARSESRLTAIGHKMGRLQSELSLKRGATSSLEATVVTLEREKSKSRIERQNAVEEKVPKVLTEQEMIAAYTTRVAMRSLWKVQAHKLMQAQQAAQIFCKQLLAPHQAQRVLFEDIDSPTKPGKATKKRGSLRRAATKPVRGKEGRKGTKTSTSPTSASAKTTSRGSLKRATLHRHPVPQVAQSEDICIGSTSKPSAHGPHGQPKLKRDVTQVLSTRRASRASIESRRSSVDAGGLMESVLSVGAARASTVPMISVRAASPRSSANSSSSSSSATESGAESAQLEDATVAVPVQRRHNIMTDLLETKALRNEVQASLGEQELEKSNQWAEDWIRRKSMQEDANQELSMPDGKHLLRRTGLAEITPLLADSALGLDVDLAGLDDSSDEETLQRNPATLVEDFIRSSAAATAKPKQAPRIPGREAVRLSTTLNGPPVLFAQSKDSTQAKGPKSARSKSRKKERTLKSDGKEDLSNRGFLADPLVKKLEREFGHQRSLKDSSRMSSRREVSTSTTREPGDPEAEGLQEDSLMAMSSVHSTEKYGYLSYRAIAEAVGDDPRARRERSSIPLPRLVAVRKDGPGDAEAVQYVAKGRKGVVSAAMVQAARMHPGKSSRSRPTSKQEFRAQTDAAVEMPDNLMPLMPDDPTSSRDRPAVHFPEASDLEEELNSLRVPQTRMESAGRVSRTSEPSPSPSGWSHSHQGEVAARSSRTAGSVLTTRPRECTPMLTARAKKYFNGASLR